MSHLLAIEQLRGGYGHVEVLRGVDLHVDAGEVVALLGSNGAGKSTLNNTVCGLFPAWSGRVVFDGVELTRAHYKEVVRAGLIQVPEGRRVFPNLMCWRTWNSAPSPVPASAARPTLTRPSQSSRG